MDKFVVGRVKSAELTYFTHDALDFEFARTRNLDPIILHVEWPGGGVFLPIPASSSLLPDGMKTSWRDFTPAYINRVHTNELCLVRKSRLCKFVCWIDAGFSFSGNIQIKDMN